MAYEWWTALLVMAWATGMRRDALLALWEGVNLKTGEAVSRGSDNRDLKDAIVNVLASVGLLEKLKGIDARFFPWAAQTWLDHELLAINTEAGIHLPCVDRQPYCTDKCHSYTLYDFRRAHATYH
jgi:hypothetical protein